MVDYLFIQDNFLVWVKVGSFMFMFEGFLCIEYFDVWELEMYYWYDYLVILLFYIYYEDDGKSFNFVEKGLYMMLQFNVLVDESVDFILIFDS